MDKAIEKKMDKLESELMDIYKISEALEFMAMGFDCVDYTSEHWKDIGGNVRNAVDIMGKMVLMTFDKALDTFYELKNLLE